MIHIAESDIKDIPDGRVVRVRCGKRLIFRSHSGKPQGGRICLICDGPKITGTPPHILAVYEEEKPLAHSAMVQ
ncbi:MAG: hypothetical protein AAB556_00910 [Patescibacteria group bacterium]